MSLKKTFLREGNFPRPSRVFTGVLFITRLTRPGTAANAEKSCTRRVQGRFPPGCYIGVIIIRGAPQHYIYCIQGPLALGTKPGARCKGTSTDVPRKSQSVRLVFLLPREDTSASWTHPSQLRDTRAGQSPIPAMSLRWRLSDRTSSFRIRIRIRIRVRARARVGDSSGTLVI